MMEKGIIEHSSNPWAAGMVLIEKKDDTKRFCLEYRSLNSKIIKDAYPLPLIDDSLDRLQGATLFCTLDQHSGYWQVEMEEDCTDCTGLQSCLSDSVTVKQQG